MADIRTLRPEWEPYASLFIKELNDAGIRTDVTSVRRGATRQAALYRAYQRGESRYPAAPPGTSTHEQGMAFDMVVSPRSRQAQVGHLWERWGFTWGGRFHDPIHFDFRPRGRPARGAPIRRAARARRPRITAGQAARIVAGSAYDVSFKPLLEANLTGLEQATGIDVRGLLRGPRTRARRSRRRAG